MRIEHLGQDELICHQQTLVENHQELTTEIPLPRGFILHRLVAYSDLSSLRINRLAFDHKEYYFGFEALPFSLLTGFDLDIRIGAHGSFLLTISVIWTGESQTDHYVSWWGNLEKLR